MQTLSRFAVTLGLTLLLTISAYAGEIQLGKDDPPPPSNSSSMMVPSETPSSGDNAYSVVQGDSVSEFALGLLQGLLSVF